MEMHAKVYANHKLKLHYTIRPICMESVSISFDFCIYFVLNVNFIVETVFGILADQPYHRFVISRPNFIRGQQVV